MGARAVAGGQNRHRRHHIEAVGQRADQRRACRRGEFHLRSTRIDGLAGYQLRRSGRGHRQQAVLGVHSPAAQIERAAPDGIHTQRVEAEAGAYNVADGIHRAHFVEVHLLNRHRVDLGFGFTQLLKNRRGHLLHAA